MGSERVRSAVVLKSVDVRIRCPGCDAIETAVCELYEGDPYWTYIHECSQCGYLVLESEWDEVKDAPDNWFTRCVRKLELVLTGHWTYCGGCRRFSPHRHCDCGDREEGT